MRSTGMSLAQLASVIELAMRTAIKDGDLKVTDAILDESFEEFNSGEKKTWNDDLLIRVARHEAGHAFLCWQSGETPSYLTIVARGSHGGYMEHAAEENSPLMTKRELMNRIRTALGGRAAELVYYGEEDGLSTGAGGDLRSATRVAAAMIRSYGMDRDAGLSVDEGEKELSPDVRAKVNRLLAEQMTLAVETIRNNRDKMDRLVEQLLKKNKLTAREIEACLS